MRESFIFYKSFYDAIEFLGEKAQLKLYKSIMKLNFNCCENVTEIEQLCDEIETELKQNRLAFAQFLLIKPQLLANIKRYKNGCKGKDYGALGGAPKNNKNALKNNPKTTPNNNVNENENNNENEEEVKEETTSPTTKIQNEDCFFGEYCNVYLDKQDYGKFYNECLNQELFNSLVEELSQKIARGDPKCPIYDEKFPHAHFLILKSFLKFRKENPHKFKVKNSTSMLEELEEQKKKRLQEIAKALED